MSSGQSNAEDISRVYAEQQEPKQEHGDGLDRTQRPGKKHKCQFCGLTGVHEKGKDCPAFGKKCHKCHKWNHFSSVCKSGNNRGYKPRKQKPGRAKKKTGLRRLPLTMLNLQARMPNMLNLQARMTNFSVRQQSTWHRPRK